MWPGWHCLVFAQPRVIVLSAYDDLWTWGSALPHLPLHPVIPVRVLHQAEGSDDRW